jgi:NAD(P)-dependent dehydrogenase (short-subunit alcohol dehydrogenase family)
MEDVLGYAGRHVVVTGAASGMGAATATILTQLGARVTALDVRPSEVLVDRVLEVDLRDRDSIETAAESINDRSTAISAAPGCRARRFPASTSCWSISLGRGIW